MSQFALGHKALISFCRAQKPLDWSKAKLSAEMFRPNEVAAFEWVAKFVKLHHTLPQVATLTAQFPSMAEVEAVEPPSYYTAHLQGRFSYDTINAANLKSQSILAEDPTAIEEAMAVSMEANRAIKALQYRSKIVDVGVEGPGLVLTAYQNTLLVEQVAEFGWEYLDKMTGGLMGGDIVSFVGRPAAGKTFKVLRTGIHNWQKGRNVLIASMEMSPLPIVQRVAAMYAHTNLTQLKKGAYSTIGGAQSTYSQFIQGLKGIATEKGKLWIVDGNLAASPEDIFELAVQLGADIVMIDGAYLMRNKNPRLDRFTRVAENAEVLKVCTSDLGIPTFASWQFNREAAKKKDPKQTGGLEDIAYSDVIGQISTVVLGMFQEDTVETLFRRLVKVMKGRNGEVGEFYINWNFNTMDFSQVSIDPAEAQKVLSFL